MTFEAKDYLAAGLAAIMVLGPMAAGALTADDQGMAVAPVTQDNAPPAPSSAPQPTGMQPQTPAPR